MKYSRKYPAPGDGETNLPPVRRVAGLPVLVWIALIVIAIAGYGAFDHLKGVKW
ncbi:hypothetical protein [Magnetovibrio blakemorei]|uniref:hypothetical protein n=1 Tax=Magnetovibrio blakemorei TaxID=28181 RepID=UPI0014814F8C|nr:hypothetical protein [Magnetovibrio blakemorei]